MNMSEKLIQVCEVRAQPIDTDLRIPAFEKVIEEFGCMYTSTRRSSRGGVRVYERNTPPLEVEVMYNSQPELDLMWWVGVKGKSKANGVGEQSLYKALKAVK